MTFGGGEMTGGEMTMGRNDRIPIQQLKLSTSLELSSLKENASRLS